MNEFTKKNVKIKKINKEYEIACRLIPSNILNAFKKIKKHNTENIILK